jgi:hypothetical protein
MPLEVILRNLDEKHVYHRNGIKWDNRRVTLFAINKPNQSDPRIV